MRRGRPPQLLARTDRAGSEATESPAVTFPADERKAWSPGFAVFLEGFVYNVSPYMEYHPGGEEELMRAAGSDGTDLFDQVHRWVNYESMLKECLVGRMAVKPAVPK
eukprot:bmy_20474T0